MEAPDGEGKPRFWLAPLDHRSPPREIPSVEGRHAIYGPGGEIFFLRMEGSSGFVYSVKSDGTGLRKVFEQTALSRGPVTPDGRWVVAWAPLPGNRPAAQQVFPLGGGSPVVIGGTTWLQWSPAGDSLWFSGGAIADDRTYIVPLRQGKALPRIAAGGFRSEEEVARLPGARQEGRGRSARSDS